MYLAVHQLVGRAFVCSLLELATQTSKPDMLPTSKESSVKARYFGIIFRKISLYKLNRVVV